MQQKVLENMISAGKKRSYLPYVAYNFIIDFLNQINEETFSANVWPYLQTELVKPLSEQNLDTLHTLLFIQNKFPLVVKETYKEHFGGKNIINEDSLESITKILTVSFYRKITSKNITEILNAVNLFEVKFVFRIFPESNVIDNQFTSSSLSYYAKQNMCKLFG